MTNYTIELTNNNLESRKDLFSCNSIIRAKEVFNAYKVLIREKLLINTSSNRYYTNLSLLDSKNNTLLTYKEI